MTVIMLDFDGAQLPAGWLDRLGFVARQFGVRVLGIEIDRTRRGWHVMAAVTGNVAPLKLVLMQALCGSDYRRETFNGVRAGRLRGVNVFWRDRFNQLFTEHHRRVTA